MAGKIDSVKQMDVTGTNNYAIVGGLQYAWGNALVANSGTTVTFPRAFSVTPAVICTTQDTNEQTAWVTARSTTAVTMKQRYTGNPLNVCWVAIGLA